MLFDIMSIVVFCAALSMTITQIVKSTNAIDKRWMMVVSALSGCLVGIVITPFTAFDTYTCLCLGIVSGFAASGIFDLKQLQELLAANKK